MSNTQTRKGEHLRICLEEDVQFQQLTNGLENYRLIHCCLPELDRNQIDLSTTFLNKKLKAPILISSMTGGTAEAKIINYRLAEIAQQYQLAMGVGSQRVAIEQPELIDTFSVRHLAPDIPLFANLGAVQLNYNYGFEQCQRLVDTLEADALILHLNPLQESIQANGDTNFRGILDKIGHLCWNLKVPVIVKEVGNGISGKIAERLIDAGVSAIDVAGAGGTSWAKVESQRADHHLRRRLGETFAEWGLPTADCIIDLRTFDQEVPLIASGGLRNGLDVVKCLALGADIAGLAQPFLKAASESLEAVDDLAQVLIAEITTALFCTGKASIYELKYGDVIQKI